MKESEHRSSPMGVGVISILTVLLVLTLSVFAALTLASAKADLALSQKNAETVAAYYAADAQATQLYADFAAGTDSALDTAIPMTENQSLVLRLERMEDGSVRILEWRTVSVEPEVDTRLPVWDGSIPEEEEGDLP